MKIHMLILAVLTALLSQAQSQNDIGKDVFKHLNADALILSEEGLIKGASQVEAFVSSFNGSAYKTEFSKIVNTNLTYEMGVVQSESRSYAVMFLKTTNTETSPSIEFLVMHEKTSSNEDLSDIDKARQEWMALCNAHKAGKLVEQLYTTDALYYNRGRLLEGTKAITAEYAYMNSPGYSLKLTPKHVIMVTPDIVYEIGQCSGSYPLPYMLVWKKHQNGKWQVLMDSNY